MCGVPSVRWALGALVIAGSACTHDFDALGLTSSAAAGSSSSGTGAAGGAGEGGASPAGSSGGGIGAAAGDGGTANVGGAPAGGAPAGGAPAGGAGGEPPLASCAEQYGDAPDYATCVEDGEVCAFYTIFGGSTSCAAFCGARGGKCSTVYNQGSPDNLCAYDTSTRYDCAGNWNTMVCVCTRGCGGEPACSGGTVCDGAACI